MGIIKRMNMGRQHRKGYQEPASKSGYYPKGSGKREVSTATATKDSVRGSVVMELFFILTGLVSVS